MERPLYRCPFVQPFVLDGRLEKAPWTEVPWTRDFMDIQGPEAPKPFHRTRVKMVWTSQGLVIGAMLEDTHLWATLTEHDSVIFKDNDFEVFLDPDGDRENYLELEINALNTTWDLLLPRTYWEGGPALDSYEVKGLETKVHLMGTLNDPSDEDEGWSVEILLPWRSLKELAGGAAPPKPGDQWRINFSRVQWDHVVSYGVYSKVPQTPERNWVWSPQGVIDMHRPERWGVLEFCQTLDDPILPPPDFQERDWLMEVYWAQMGRPAPAPPLAELGLDRLEGKVEIFVAAGGFSAQTKGWRIGPRGRLLAR